MDHFWWINQFGILLEVFGAIVIVVSAFTTKRAIKDVPDSYEAELPIKLRDIVAKQAVTELGGFLLLAIGSDSRSGIVLMGPTPGRR